MPLSAHGGVMFRVDGELFFLPASIAIKVMPTPEMARVPGGPTVLRGVALVDGDMIPVVELSSAFPPSSTKSARGRSGAGAMLVCVVLGECVGLVGLGVVATGRFEVDRFGEVGFAGEAARAFDVAAIIAKVREGRWAV
jgi:chemotaxis signal transduction protein